MAPPERAQLRDGLRGRGSSPARPTPSLVLPVSLALRQFAVPPHIAVFAADDYVDGLVGVAEVPHFAGGGGVDPGEAAGAEALGRAVAEGELDFAAVDEVELLLLVVEVAAGLIGRRQHDRVDAEGGDPQLLADLAEAGALAEAVEVGDGVALTFGHVRVGRVAHRRRLRSSASPMGPAARLGERVERPGHCPWRARARSADSR